MVATDIRCNSGETVGKSLSNLLWSSIMPSSCLFLRNIGLASFVLLFRTGRNKKYKKIQNTIITPVWKEVDYSDQLVSPIFRLDEYKWNVLQPKQIKKSWRSKREATTISIHLLGWYQAVKKLRFLASPSNVKANYQCTWRTNLLKLTNPYISLERCAKRGTISQK